MWPTSFSRVVGKTTSLNTVMFTPKLVLENIDPGMAHTMALQLSRLVGKATSLHTVMLKPKLGLVNTVPGVVPILISVNVNLKLTCLISISENTARLA